MQQADQLGSAGRKRARKNTTRACDSCKAKKTRCDGALPCSRCQAYDGACTYNAPYTRGQVPPTPSAERSEPPPTERLPTRVVRSPHESREETPEAAESILGPSSNIAFSHAVRLELSSRRASPVPEPGRPVQVAVGEENADRPVKRVKRLHFSEPPLPSINLARHSLPNTERGLEMCAWYFENASPTYRFLHRPSVESKVRALCGYNEWLGGPTEIEDTKLTKRDECTVLMCWALGCQFPLAPSGKTFSSREKAWIQAKGQDFYAVARMILDNDVKDQDRLGIIHVRFMMCLYLLTTSRLKAAWDLFSSVRHIANNLDLSRPAVPLSSVSSSSSSVAMRSRIFWSIYTLDTYLCAMLGKILMYDERDIRIEHSTLDDHEIELDGKSSNRSRSTSNRPSLMLGPAIHARLARIVRRALRALYLDPGAQFNAQVVADLDTEMTQWEADLPGFLTLTDHGGLMPIFARQSGVIRLAKLHALILIFRPSLPLSGLASSSAGSGSPGFETQFTKPFQDRCVGAALDVVDIMSTLFKEGSMDDTYWFSAYVNFCAGTVLLVYIGHNAVSMTQTRRQVLWDAAHRCCDMERRLAASNRLARRYVATLEVLFEKLSKRLSNMENYIHHIPNISDHRDSLALPRLDNSVYANFQYGGAAQSESDLLYLNNAVSPMSAGDPNFSLDTLLTDSVGPASFFEFDSIVSGGVTFGWG